MPIYEYRCQGCQAKFELRRGFGQADDPATCPNCQGDQVRRLLSVFAAYSKGADGAPAKSVGGSSCGSCSSGSCASCGH